MTAANPQARHALYQRFTRRNRWIGRLRVIVPVLGIGFLSIPVVEFLVSSMMQNFSVGGVRLDSDNLVIDSPRFEGVTANGEVYVMIAERAESRLGDFDTVELYNLDLDLSGEGGYHADVFITRGSWTLSTERLVSNEDVQVSDSTGASGVLAGVEVDWPRQIIESEGPVRFDFDGGDTLLAREMRHDIQAAHWWFTEVNLTMTPAPDAGADRSIDDLIETSPAGG